MAGKRNAMHRNKVVKSQRIAEREIAEMLRQGREEKARIKAEQLISNQKLESAYDILETQCELLHTRIQYIDQSKECPPDLIMPVASLVYAEKRISIPELADCLRQFELKFGKAWCRNHTDNLSQDVAPKLVGLLAISPPREEAVLDCLEAVAAKFEVDWERPPSLEQQIGFAPPPLNPAAFPPALASGEAVEFDPSSPPLESAATGSIVSEGLAPSTLPPSPKQSSAVSGGFVPFGDGASKEPQEKLSKTPPSSHFAPPLPPSLKKQSHGTEMNAPSSSTLPGIPGDSHHPPDFLAGAPPPLQAAEAKNHMDPAFDELLNRFAKLKDS